MRLISPFPMHGTWLGLVLLCKSLGSVDVAHEISQGSCYGQRRSDSDRRGAGSL